MPTGCPLCGDGLADVFPCYRCESPVYADCTSVEDNRVCAPCVACLIDEQENAALPSSLNQD